MYTIAPEIHEEVLTKMRRFGAKFTGINMTVDLMLPDKLLVARFRTELALARQQLEQSRPSVQSGRHASTNWKILEVLDETYHNPRLKHPRNFNRDLALVDSRYLAACKAMFIKP